jgi:hypothetical protein
VTSEESPTRLQNWQLATDYFLSMGFNPFRDQDRTALDIVIVVLFVIITVVVVGWALLG